MYSNIFIISTNFHLRLKSHEIQHFHCIKIISIHKHVNGNTSKKKKKQKIMWY